MLRYLGSVVLVTTSTTVTLVTKLTIEFHLVRTSFSRSEGKLREIIKGRPVPLHHHTYDLYPSLLYPPRKDGRHLDLGNTRHKDPESTEINILYPLLVIFK